MEPSTNRILTFDMVVDRVPWCKATVHKMVNSGEIPMTWSNGRWYISEARLLEAADAGFPPPVGRHVRSDGQKLRALKKAIRTADSLEEAHRLVA